MSKIAIESSDTGTGTLTIQAPVTNEDRVLTLPDSGGTIETDATLIRTSVVTASTYEVTASDRNLYVDASVNTVTITLPALSLGRRLTVRASDVTNAITIQRAGADTIVGLTSVTLSSVGDFWTFEGGPNRWELVDGVESGSGANGSYIRRANGSTDQWLGTFVIDTFLNSSTLGSQTWTFPRAAVGGVAWSGGLHTTGGATPPARDIHIRTTSTAHTTNAAFRVESVNQLFVDGDTVSAQVLMSGRWYA